MSRYFLYFLIILFLIYIINRILLKIKTTKEIKKCILKKISEDEGFSFFSTIFNFVNNVFKFYVVLGSFLGIIIIKISFIYLNIINILFNLSFVEQISFIIAKYNNFITGIFFNINFVKTFISIIIVVFLIKNIYKEIKLSILIFKNKFTDYTNDSIVEDKKIDRVKVVFNIIFYIIIIVYTIGFITYQINSHIQTTEQSNIDIISKHIKDKNNFRYYFYNNNIYLFNENDELYTFNKDGKHKKMILKSTSFNNSSIILVYNKYIYYYNKNDHFLKQLNLENKGIKNIIRAYDLKVINNSMNNEEIIINYLKNNKTYFTKINLTTGKLFEEKEIELRTKYYFYNLENNNIYYVVDNFPDKILYENNKEIFRYKSELSNNFETLFIKDNYLFVITYNEILKINLNDYSITDRKEISNKYVPISSVTNNYTNKNMDIFCYPIFTTTDYKNIYIFDGDELSFEFLKDIPRFNGYIRKYENKYLISYDSSIFLYDKNSNNTYNNLFMNYSIQNEILYTVNYNEELDNTYFIDKIYLNKKSFK